MKAAILGLGKQGVAIAHSMNVFGYELLTCEPVVDRVRGVQILLGENFTNLPGLDLNKIKDFAPDIVVSSLPYHKTEQVGHFCVDNNFRYCDLGGNVGVSNSINEYARDRGTKPVFTDLGLAPGWVNILAEEYCRKLYGAKIKSVQMMVGGLPQVANNTNPLNYSLVFSTDGLINEYKDDCKVILGGKETTVSGLSNLETVYTKKLGKLEAFCTSGGLSHSLSSMIKRGVSSCMYKTLRYPGHRDIIKMLFDSQVKRDVIDQILNVSCRDQVPDCVIMIVKIVDHNNAKWVKEHLIMGNCSDFTSMQKTTAFPTAAVATLMGEGEFDERYEERRGYKDKKSLVLGYEDVPFDKFNNKLQDLGIHV